MRVNVYPRCYTTAKGERRWYLVIREAGRKDRNIPMGCVSRKVAEERRIVVLNELLNGTSQRISEVRPYFGEFCEKFMTEFVSGALAPRTVFDYRCHLGSAQKAFQGVRIDQIRREDLERYLGEMPISGRSKNIRLSVLKQTFQKAVEWHYLSSSPASKIRRWREECHGSRPLTEAELGRVLGLAAPWESAVIKVMVYTGMRPGELSQLKLIDIDWEKRILKIVSDKARKTKNRKSRVVPLSPGLEEELKVLREYWPNMQYIHEGAATPKYLPRTEAQKEYVFCHRDGRPIKSFKRSIGNAFEKARVEGVTPHGLRKTFCSMLARQNVHPKVAQRLMGHSDIRLTMDIYTEVEDDQLRSAVNSLPSVRDLQKEKFRVIGGEK